MRIFFLLVVMVFSSYNYTKRGDDWGDLCLNGKKQSPIDLSGNQTNSSAILRLVGMNYQTEHHGLVYKDDHKVYYGDLTYAKLKIINHTF